MLSGLLLDAASGPSVPVLPALSVESEPYMAIFLRHIFIAMLLCLCAASPRLAGAASVAGFATLGEDSGAGLMAVSDAQGSVKDSLFAGEFDSEAILLAQNISAQISAQTDEETVDDALEEGVDEGAVGEEEALDEEPSNEADSANEAELAPTDDFDSIDEVGPELGSEVVAEIRFEGNRRIETDVLRPLLQTRVGRPLSQELVRQDIERLWSQRFFSDVVVEAEPGPEGLVLTYRLEEKPSVREIHISGADEISEEDLRKEISLRPFQIFDEAELRKSIEKIQEKYLDKGFFLTEVTPKIEEAPGQNNVDVTFVVVEHAKVEVRRVSFQGNEAISADELRGSIATREATFISFLTSDGNYKEEAFQRDLLIIQSLYYNRGYINVRVGQPAVAMSADRRYIYINIPIEEGEPYELGEIEVSGELLGDDEKVEALVQLTSGERFSSQALQRDMMALQDHYRDRGYAYVQVSPQTRVDPEERLVHIDFHIQPGEIVYIERIDIVGNTRTRDKVIRRELRISEGDEYSGSGIQNSRARVNALGFFEAVEISSKPGRRPNTMALEVAVKERPTGTFQVGLGVSNNEKLLLNANVSQNNALGWGTSVALLVQLSALRRIFSVSYSDPYFLDTNWTFAFDVFNTRQYYGSLFDRNALGGTVTGGYQLFEDFRIFLTYTLQQVDVIPTGTQAVLLANRFRGGLTSSIRGSFNFDRRDNRLFPTKGYLLTGSAEFASPYLGSQNEFERYIAVGRFYQPIKWGLVFKVNTTFGYIRSPADNPVPVSELFFEGGINSLRGYDFRTIAPTVDAGMTPGGPLIPIAVGGNKELLTNWEIEFPVLEEAGLRGVVFFDAGNVWAENQSFFDPDSPGNLGLLMSAGFGARWFTPLGPLRFELGFPITRRPGDRASLFEFTIGNFF